MDEHHTRSGQIPSVAAAAPPLTWYQPPPTQPSPAYAGFWRRFLAKIIDVVLVSSISSSLVGLLGGLLMQLVVAGLPDADVWLVFIVSFAAAWSVFVLLDWLYAALMESSSWQATLGKRALGVVVTDRGGHRISFGRATGRYFGQYLSLLTLGVGYLIQPFTAKRQALHDIVAGTLVVRVRSSWG